MLPGYHGNGGDAPLSPSSPVSKDATDFPERKDATSTKKILKSVSAYFNTGELVAIMGPSGCGKTTLLDLLTGRRRHGHIEGQVYVNGVGLGQVQDWYARKIGYVLQLAVPYYEELTVRQNLFFAAHMRLPKKTSSSEKYERVEQIIAETGLTQMADTVIGGSVGPGLSGGQKRRLCVALQLINMPSVLFLDEPTSGLDASSSLELLNHLNLVAESGRLVILTIHQPRLEIFHLFHKILFLCDGQVAYYGEPSMAPEIFIKAYARATTKEYRLSEEAPKIDAKNPADTIMDLLNCPEARHAILDYYQGSGEPEAVQEAIVTSQENARKTFAVDTMTKSTVDGAGRFNRVFVLEGRTAEKQSLGQLLYFPLIFFAFGVIVGTVYFRAEERDGILLMSAYCVYCCASPLFLSSVLMAHLNKALNIYHLERADGCGRSLENVIQTFVRTTAFCVLPVILCSLMSYFMVMTSYDLGRLVLVTIISLVLNQTWIAVYMMVICAQPQIAHRICPMVSAIGGFAGGFLVPRPQMPIVYNLLFYINPQFYGYAAITKVLLKNVRLTCEYDSTLSCISTDGNAVLTRFGLDTVNPYENLVIMLGMTVLSLLLSWLFLEAKYFKLRCFSKTPPSFLVDVPEETITFLEKPVEPVEPVDDTPAKEENNDAELKTFVSRPGINRRSTNRTSAKSRLGLIRENEGFHSVKLPAPSNPRAQSPEMTFATANEQSIDGENQEFRTRRSRLFSVSGDELWKHTKLQMRERKVNLEQRMSMVQNIATQYSIKHSQSMRKRQSKKQPSAPRRTTLASSAASEVKRKDFAPSHYGRLHEILGNSLFREELEELPEPPLDDPASGGDIIDGGIGASAKEDGVGVDANSTVVVPETQENQQGNLDPSFKETLQGDTSSQHINTSGDRTPLKNVSIAGFTEILDV